MDPFEEHTDEEVWSVIEKVGLKNTIDSAAKQLDMEVIDNGSNFSLGQRQLLCMGRALLRNSRVLMMDEATASVDMDSDALIQKTVREAFSECTALTIAHRLNTIMDSDKILFLDSGKVTEYDDPQTLLKNATGDFSRLVEKSGKAQEKNLNAYRQRRRDEEERILERYELVKKEKHRSFSNNQKTIYTYNQSISLTISSFYSPVSFLPLSESPRLTSRLRNLASPAP